VSGQLDAAWELPQGLNAHVDPAYRSFAGPGWRPILERLHDRLLAVDPRYRLHQVKEKMGILRIYAADEAYAERPEIREQIEAAIAGAVRELATTCERCGRPGRLRGDTEWRRLRQYLLTLCDRCVPVELAEYGVPSDAIAEFVEANAAP
jgi:hypothetical protein